MLTRRRLLSSLSVAGAGALAGTSSAGTSIAAPRRSLRVAFLTDIHVPAEGMDERISACLGKVLDASPDLVLLGGDLVMAVDPPNLAEVDADAQFASFRRNLMRPLSRVETAAVIGNHCIWQNDKSKAIAAYDMPGRYHRRDAGHWRFIFLDSFQGDGSCRIDEEQMEWLRGELASTRRPVLILSHAPIITATSLIDLEPDAAGGFQVPACWQTSNLRELRALFRLHPHVRLALSGHMHLIDRCEIDRVTYVCGGAMSGAWWDGAYNGFPPAYLLFDLHEDGSFRQQTVFWDGDEPQPAPAIAPSPGAWRGSRT